MKGTEAVAFKKQTGREKQNLILKKEGVEAVRRV